MHATLNIRQLVDIWVQIYHRHKYCVVYCIFQTGWLTHSVYSRCKVRAQKMTLQYASHITMTTLLTCICFFKSFINGALFVIECIVYPLRIANCHTTALVLNGLHRMYTCEWTIAILIYNVLLNFTRRIHFHQWYYSINPLISKLQDTMLHLSSPSVSRQ